MNKRHPLIVLLLACVFGSCALAQKARLADKPVFVDPIYDGAADPVIIWNKKAKEWLMFYTNRRATIEDTTGVKWVHGTRIGIASSKDGAVWRYVDTANIAYRPHEGYTFWAPDVIEHNGTYHMYLTYVPGVFSNWNHPRNIVHLTSKDLFNWKYESVVPLANDKVIDAAVYALPGGGWRMWYNNERTGKSIYYADSKDLFTWEDRGQAIAARGEGPKVFQWQGKYWMIVDAWKGMEVYSSDDLLTWNKQRNRILEEGGTGRDDGAIGGHCDVIVNNNKAYVYYFTHPGRTKVSPAPANTVAAKRSVIQVAELKYENGEITCDRNAPVSLYLQPNKN